MRRSNDNDSNIAHSGHLAHTPHAEVFEAIIRIAERLFDVPMVSVTVMDSNRQWFSAKSKSQIEVSEQRPTFSGQALVENEYEPTFIPDTLADDEWADNDLVRAEPFARFYGGLPLKAPGGQHIGTVCLIDQNPRDFQQADVEALEDLAMIAAREIAARQLSDTDPLTEIQNQRGFSLLAESKLSLCEREKLPVSLIYFDLESFESISEQLGYDAGDRVLVHFAEELSTLFRQSDVPARLHGDKFALLLVNCSQDSANACVERMTRAIEAYNNDPSHDYKVSFSSGIAQYQPGRHSEVGELISDAEAALAQVDTAGSRSDHDDTP